jgi:hypothetical protein
LFHLDFSSFVLTSMTLGVVLVLALWIYYEQREQRAYAGERAQSLRHCLKCGRIYSAPRSAASAPCPDCGFENSKLKF